MNRRQVWSGASIGLGAAVIGAAVGWRHWHHPAEQAPAEFWRLRFELPEGGEIAMAEWRGRPLVLNFWATWCAPCVRELPEIDRFAHDFHSKGWRALALAIDRVESVREFLSKVPLTLPVAMGGSDGFEWIRLLGNPHGALPFSIVFGPDGTVLHRKLGETSYAELAKLAQSA